MRRISVAARLTVVTLVVLASLIWLEPARATPEYPLVLDNAVSTPAMTVRCADPGSRCLICHTTSRGGEGTAEQVFALRLRDFDFNRGNDASALRAAVAQLSEIADDSDEDGTPDKEELRQCGNPSGDSLGAGPEYGCDGAQLVPVTGNSAGLSLLAAGVATLLVRLGRRKRG